MSGIDALLVSELDDIDLSELLMLELAELHVALRNAAVRIDNDFHRRTGWSAEEFLDGMRELLRPA